MDLTLRNMWLSELWQPVPEYHPSVDERARSEAVAEMCTGGGESVDETGEDVAS